MTTCKCGFCGRIFETDIEIYACPECLDLLEEHAEEDENEGIAQ